MVDKMVNFDVENPSEDALRSIDVHELLPQQEPFVMIGTPRTLRQEADGYRDRGAGR